MNAPAPARVALTALSLTDLRNYASLQLFLASPLVVLTGPNGAGKTNLLEAISLLTPGRGLRRAAFEEISRHRGGGGWAVAATVGSDGVETRIGTGLAPVGAGDAGGRKMRINGAPASSAEAFLGYLRVLWLTPAMDGLFTGPAGDRRRFLDRLVLTVDPGHGRRTRDFERLLTQRNRLLEENGSPGWLDAVEVQLAEKAVALALARTETVALLATRLDAASGAAFPAGKIALSGGFDQAIAGRSAAEAEFWYRSALAERRASDRAAGRTLEGPHRSDLEIAFAQKDMPAALSSTGEQKALLIALILAHAELVAHVSGMAPVLLLDEIAAHLDPARRTALFARLAALGCQAFLTGTDPALFAELPVEAARYYVADGKVTLAGGGRA
jgi:DNA replication and repair protein RecF